MNNYKILWADLHSNIHHEQINELPRWIEQAQQMVDFWPVVYYPYYMRKTDNGIPVEDRYDDQIITEDWEYVRQLTEAENKAGYPMFMGYEWQGSGLDGDHNVYFKDNNGDIAFPLLYQQLKSDHQGKSVIAIPHHVAYQLHNRGKNWSVHDEGFSPLVEIYSSHGSSENDNNPLAMVRHTHMGPRTGETSVESGIDRGYRFGIVASGDNHHCPAVYNNGSCAVLAKSNSKDDIWEALINRHAYGVSKEKIHLNFSIDQQIMGSIIKPSQNSELNIEVIACNAIDRVEIISEDRVIEMIAHSSTWENQPLGDIVRFKFQLEVGWGPDGRIFPDIESKLWTGHLETSGKLLSIEKCWNNFGQSLTQLNDQSCDFSLTTYSSYVSERWMGIGARVTEGFIFEIEAELSSSIHLVIDNEKYDIPVTDILANSRLIPLAEEAKELLKSRFNFTEYYRSDPWWHNSYKIKINKGAPELAFKKVINRTIDTSKFKQIRVRVWQKNGAVAWSSPIFFERRD